MGKRALFVLIIMYGLFPFCGKAQNIMHIEDSLNVKDNKSKKIEYANSLSLHADECDDAEALLYYAEAKKVWDSFTDKSSYKDYCRLLNIYAVRAYNYNLKLSINLVKEELSIYQQTANPDSIVAYSNLAFFYSQYDDSLSLRKALFYNDHVLKIRESLPLSPELAITYRNMARIYIRLNESSSAIKYATKAVETSLHFFGKESWEYALSLSYLGAYNYASEDITGALDCYCKAAQTHQLDDDYSFLHNYASILFRTGNLEDCVKYRQVSSNIIKSEWFKSLAYLNEENSFLWLFDERNRALLTAVIGEAHESGNSDLSKLAFNNALFLKNIGNSDVIKEQKRITNKDSINIYSDQINESSSTWDIFPKVSPEWTDVSALLESNEIAIEIVKDYYVDKYYACVLRRNWNSPQIISLDLNEIKNQINGEKRDTVWLPLYDCIWQPLINIGNISNGEKIYMSLDSDLNMWPIEGIMDYSYNCVSDRFEIFRVSSTLRINEIKGKFHPQKAVCYGGLFYDSSKEVVTEVSKRYTSRHRGISSSIILNDSVISTLRSEAKYLPWTKNELDTITTTLQNKGVEVLIYTKDDGVEESFKELENDAVQIVHVATHGFFTPSNNVYETAFQAEQDIYHNAGLLFSGAVSLSADSIRNVDDGILRADEIANLNLDNVELLVLSACDTGRGASFSKDGITGLQKAFKMAGVKTILMTLRKIDDAATFLFMKTFYKTLCETADKHKAYKAGINSLKDSEEFGNFEIWSSYIMLD